MFLNILTLLVQSSKVETDFQKYPLVKPMCLGHLVPKTKLLRDLDRSASLSLPSSAITTDGQAGTVHLSYFCGCIHPQKYTQGLLVQDASRTLGSLPAASLSKKLLAAGLGLEPRYSPPKGDVLPLDDPAILYNSILHTPYFILPSPPLTSYRKHILYTIYFPFRRAHR